MAEPARRRGARDLPPALIAAVILGVAIRAAYVVITRHQALVGDEIAYNSEGALLAHGKWFYGSLPYGVLHATAWKPPGYPLWVGFWYWLLGVHPARVELVQALTCGPATIVLTWALARHLFGERAAILAAFLVAVYPMAWQYEERLYSEALAVPLTVLVLLLTLERRPTPRRAAAVGLLLGVLLLIRTSSLLVLPSVFICWGMSMGVRRGLRPSLITLALVVAVVAPWTIRNEISLHGFIPVSLDEAAAYGTFNSTAAHDPGFPYAWLPDEPRDRDLFDPRHPLPEPTLAHKLESRVLHYIVQHPISVPEAFFWNGISRLWELRRPSHALDEVRFEGRTRSVAIAGLLMYYPLMALALLALWRHRRRRGLLLPVAVAALAASIVFTTDSGTRYRAPLEPLIVVLASAAVGV